MHSDVRWLIPDRVFCMRLAGTLTPENLDAALAQCRALLAQDHVAPVLQNELGRQLARSHAGHGAAALSAVGSCSGLLVSTSGTGLRLCQVCLLHLSSSIKPDATITNSLS